MLIEIGTVIAASVFGIFIGHSIAAFTTSRPAISLMLQTIVAAAIAEVVVVAFDISPLTTVAASLGPVGLSLLFYLNERRQHRKALNGGYGQKTQWAEELVTEGNPRFTIAVQALPQSELREVGIIAESKEELYELTLERFDELVDEPLPSEFQ